MKVAELFLSIQGEGISIGKLTYFVRTAGCSLNCSWCDTKWQRDPSQGKEMPVSEIIDCIGENENVCFTGGEPLEQIDQIDLIEKLCSKGKNIVIETNGNQDISKVPNNPKICISMDVKCPSSSEDKSFNYDNLKFIEEKDQIKFVISNDQDYEYAKDFLRKNKTKANIIFSPTGGKDLIKLAEKVVSDKLNVRVLPQLHKIIWGDKKGV